MGDDTWTTVFPDSFSSNMTHPYDSFNVEDLHTVDEGVIRHLFPLLRDETKPWDVIIGHFLGADHVGHRVGPDHPAMKAKLEQMDEVLRDVVALLDDETLLVVMGDHGMDRKGDHGGDTDLETSAAMWFYSKGRALVHPDASIPQSLLPKSMFPGASVPHRSIQQVDLAPSLALLLGVPVPFNSLGSVVPELFWDDAAGQRYDHALRLNAAQVQRYLETYRASSNGAELDGAWLELNGLWQKAMPQHKTIKHDTWSALKDLWNSAGDTTVRTGEWVALHEFLDSVLSVCRSLWAQFNVNLIGMGLSLLVLATLASVELWWKLAAMKAAWDLWAAKALLQNMYATGAGAFLGLTVLPYRARIIQDIEALQLVMFSAAMFSSISMIVLARPPISLPTIQLLRGIDYASFPLLLVLHAGAFGSNSFTVWEDRIISFLLLSTLARPILLGISAPISRLRYRILGFSAVFAVCVRLMAASTVCREEQQPHCHVTFFASASITAPPQLVLALALPCAVLLPYFIRRMLRISQSDKGLAALFLPWLVPFVLVQASAAWMLEWIETSDVASLAQSGWLRPVRTALGWSALGSSVVVGGMLWWVVPLCINVMTTAPTDPKAKKQVQVIGFANAYGAPYLMFWCIPLGVVYTVSQLTSQVVMGLATVALVAYLEVLDSVRDVRGLDEAFASSTPSAALDLDTLRLAGGGVRFTDITPLALLALHTFYATGHQSTISSIQWKSAFLLSSTLQYPSSVVLMVINEWGAPFLLAAATPLVALWNLAPLPHPASTVQAKRESVRAALGVMLYHSVLLLGSAASSAWLRRHLMVWKVFAPRLMNAAATLLVVDVAVLLGVGVGVAMVVQRIRRRSSSRI